MVMNCRKVTHQDVLELQEIGKLTFAQTFSDDNSEENMRAYLEEAFSLEKLTSSLNDERVAFYFAEIEGITGGYLKTIIGPASFDPSATNTLEVERIYVLQKYQGKKVGQLLMDKAIELAQSTKATFIWLGVWENNPKAIRFYEKNGFIAFGQHKFILGTDEQTDILMKRSLSNVN
jgi:diamine N-acetyltransferase